MGNGTSIGRVRGHGSAHSGTHHWLVQRFTAIGNLVTGIWLLASLVGLPNLHYGTVHEWVARPLPGTLLGLFVLSTFWHARLGLQVLVEDYVHEHANKFAAIAALNLATFAGAGFGLLCVIRLVLGA
ncbi:succinate dehydrogenase, hydrophobic membrane anchor protein [Novosphingobium sp.]|uniref:succinate dehydrogenase, hydrophobic membrane anchor protein n=1 Tax=Novosphingobium sp. TaxID=1874826 RepID=UPI0035B40EE6